ncbi:hypothetical protein BD779DRAFT_1610950 [Infundibulicybe gibba]|nr:hypothetical protein BD779DRAFT_1610950 [Infundibulicybe gibba]
MSDTLAGLQTEMANPNTTDIDAVSTADMCRMINAEDAGVAPAVALCIPAIARAIDLIVMRLHQGGRLVYIGAGTSGRPPTFSASPTTFIALIAGGDTALRRSAEGAEDAAGSVVDLGALQPPLTSHDAVMGIAASGRTPYVLAGLKHAKEVGALALGIACVEGSAMRASGDCECMVECAVGPEVVAGSTRMKAGTATKMILNMISTGVMIRIGKTFGNIMVDVAPSNEKLRARARRIFRLLAPFNTLSDARIDALITECDHSVKLALVVERLKLPWMLHAQGSAPQAGSSSARGARPFPHQ